MKNSDLESLYKLLSDSKVMKFLEEPYNKAQTLDFLTNAGMSELPLVYAVDRDNEFIGYVIFMIMMTYLMKLDGSYIHAVGVKDMHLI